ncbi:MAG: hypothetical protein Unbinned3891contig1000_14 [Prokaryotic dsDNA virus sp.]|nr:MAG: hypothetical protein Unbinned3891contig1000_14 [Prokaryotic dsDNA virus sp.]
MPLDAKKPSHRATIFIQHFPTQLREDFKQHVREHNDGECMRDALIRVFTRFVGSAGVLPIKTRTRHKSVRMRGIATSPLYVQGLPNTTKSAFKSTCYSINKTMKDVLILLMEHEMQKGESRKA